MARTKFAGSPFEPLHLTQLDADKLQQLADVFVRKNALQLEHFTRVQRQQVDESAWKLVKQREGVRVYAERTRRSSSLGGSGDADKREVDTSEAAASAGAGLPTMLVVGSVEGSLDDMMYGVVNHTLEAMRIKSSYVGDNVADAAVLATLVAPTPEKPFQSLAIKWMENEQARVYRPVVRNRDFVYMETTGFAHTAAGERLGYHLLHSVHFPQTHELEARVRGNMSVCGLYREVPGSNRVEVYVTGILNPGGSIMRSIVVSASADALVSAWRNVECAYMKKLTWMLRTTPRSFSVAGESLSSDSDDGRGSRSRRSSDATRACVTCSKGQSSLGMSRVLLRDVRKRRCNLCWKYVCTDCRVKKLLSHVNSPADKLRQREFAFCAKCVGDTVRASALSIAQRELGGGSPLAGDSDLFATNQSERVLELVPPPTDKGSDALGDSRISS